jgi:acyl-CoA thioester hydrolase
MTGPLRHRIELVVDRGDIDDLGHVGNVVYLGWVLRAAAEHAARAGWDLPALQRAGAVWVVRRHEIDYVAPALPGDAIAIETWVDEWDAASCLRRTSIRRGDVELCRAATRWVLVGFPGGRPRRIPPEMRAGFGTPRT